MDTYRAFALTATAMLFVALADLPYGYYTFLRLVVCGTGIYGALLSMRDGRSGWTTALALIALLFNPVIPIHLSREAWAALDILAALVILSSAFVVGKSSGNLPQPPA